VRVVLSRVRRWRPRSEGSVGWRVKAEGVVVEGVMKAGEGPLIVREGWGRVSMWMACRGTVRSGRDIGG
jgi:hypothetical protein